MDLDWKDWLFFLIIFVVSYWVAFVSGASKFIVALLNNRIRRKEIKTRGTISGEDNGKNFIQRVSAKLQIKR